jgi:cation:H+ antiporter
MGRNAGIAARAVDRAVPVEVAMNHYFVLVLGVVCAGVGGEAFIRGAVGVAHSIRVSPGIIAVTVAAFATSSPELAVGVRASLAGAPQVSLGDVLGSNVVNVALILALALCVSGIATPRQSIKRDFPVAIIAPIAIGVLALDGRLSRWDGLLLLAGFIAWLTATIVEARKQRAAGAGTLSWRQVGLAIVLCAVGLAFLIQAGHFVVAGARGIARSYGIGEFIIGATVVAAGTSMPELATAVIAKLRGYDEVGLGTILGSNIFNGLLIVAVVAILCPIVVDGRQVAVALVFGLLAVVFTFPMGSGFLGRRRGILLLVLYGFYLAAILRTQLV